MLGSAALKQIQARDMTVYRTSNRVLAESGNHPAGSAYRLTLHKNKLSA
jgi:hypothetical protein